jgi:hypothetical protein
MAFAEEGGSGANAGVGVELNGVEVNANGTTSVRGEDGNQNENKGTAGEDNSNSGELNSQGGENASTTDEQSLEREKHRSEVAAEVQKLLSVADRDEGIGEEVRIAAHDFASSSEEIDNAKAEVDGRPAWMTLIIGNDYKNLGAIRSELATTTNAIDRLEKARERSADPAVKADLAAQISALTASASTTEQFVVSHENAFSLLGWFFKLFNQ